MPLPRFRAECDRQFVIGALYRLVEVPDRSPKSLNHMFAVIQEAWANLPDALLDDFPTPEHLRKKALIRSGLYLRQDYVVMSKAEALRLAAALRPLDEYAVVMIEGLVVTRWTANSQAFASMDNATFQASKQKVLDYVASLIDVAPQDLESNTGGAA